MMFGVQDGGFFPKGALQLQSHEFAAEILERAGKFLRHPRQHAMGSHRPLVGQGAEFHFDGAAKIIEPGGSHVG